MTDICGNKSEHAVYPKKGLSPQGSLRDVEETQYVLSNDVLRELGHTKPRYAESHGRLTFR